MTQDAGQALFDFELGDHLKQVVTWKTDIALMIWGPNSCQDPSSIVQSRWVCNHAVLSPCSEGHNLCRRLTRKLVSIFPIVDTS